MSITVRRTAPDEYLDALNVKAAALLQPRSTVDDFEAHTTSWAETSSFSAWQGDRCVGNASQLFVDTSVPGGNLVPTGAVTRVGVLPTFRRQGVASALMGALRDEAVERGLALLSLRASEATIYRRYQFAPAGDFCSIEIDPSRAFPLRGTIAEGSLELLEPDTIVDVVEELLPRVAMRRAGAISRPRWLLERYLESARKTDKASHVVVHRSPTGVIDGYAHYDLDWVGPGMHDAGKGHVNDLFGADDATELALWNFLLSIDLVRQWTADERPLDDLIRHTCDDLRAVRITAVEDEQWVRVIDVDRSLNARSYRPVRGSVKIAVADPEIDANSQTWRIDAEGATRTDEVSDITAPVSAVAAVYFGARNWVDLAAVGEAVGDPAALQLASDLFTTNRLPVCGSFF